MPPLQFVDSLWSGPGEFGLAGRTSNHGEGMAEGGMQKTKGEQEESSRQKAMGRKPNAGAGGLNTRSRKRAVYVRLPGNSDELQFYFFFLASDFCFLPIAFWFFTSSLEKIYSIKFPALSTFWILSMPPYFAYQGLAPFKTSLRALIFRTPRSLSQSSKAFNPCLA